MSKKLGTLLTMTIGLTLLCSCQGPESQVDMSSAASESNKDSQPDSSVVEEAAPPNPSSTASAVSSSRGYELPPIESVIEYPLPEEVINRINGVSWNEEAPVELTDLAYLRMPYVDFDGEIQLGEMIVHQSLAEEVVEIFEELFDASFPIAGMVLIDDFNADDLASMAANNSSAFCSRLILGTERYSVHSYGSAIDINPVQNPYVVGSEVYPQAAAEYLDRNDSRAGMITEGDPCYNAFVSRDWSWGGHWANPDYQHFEKNIG